MQQIKIFTGFITKNCIINVQRKKDDRTFKLICLYKWHVNLKYQFAIIYTTCLIKCNVFIGFFYLLTIFSPERACPKHTYSFLFLTFINIFLDSSKLLACEHIIRSKMESVSFSYTSMSSRVPDMLNVFLRNNYVPTVYYICTGNIIQQKANGIKHWILLCISLQQRQNRFSLKESLAKKMNLTIQKMKIIEHRLLILVMTKQNIYMTLVIGDWCNFTCFSQASLCVCQLIASEILK